MKFSLGEVDEEQASTSLTDRVFPSKIEEDVGFDDDGVDIVQHQKTNESSKSVKEWKQNK